MKNLPAGVRNKAVEIANALLEEKQMDEGLAIATAISRAKDWAANRHQPTESDTSERNSDRKKHGEDRFVNPTDDGWQVKKEKSSRSEKFETKKEAVKAAKEEAKAANASITVKRKDGKIDEHISYNPNNKGRAR